MLLSLLDNSLLDLSQRQGMEAIHGESSNGDQKTCSDYKLELLLSCQEPCRHSIQRVGPAEFGRGLNVWLHGPEWLADSAESELEMNDGLLPKGCLGEICVGKNEMALLIL